jgi:hypothetical protein
MISCPGGGSETAAVDLAAIEIRIGRSVRPDGVFAKRRGADLCTALESSSRYSACSSWVPPTAPVLRAPRRQQRRVAHVLALRT